MLLDQRAPDPTGTEELYWGCFHAFKGSNNTHRALKHATSGTGLSRRLLQLLGLHAHPDILIGPEQASNLRRAHLRSPRTFTKCGTPPHPRNSPRLTPTGDPLLGLKCPPFTSRNKAPSVLWGETLHRNRTWGLLVTPNDSKRIQQTPVPPIFLVPWPTFILSQQKPEYFPFHIRLSCGRRARLEYRSSCYRKELTLTTHLLLLHCIGLSFPLSPMFL